MSNLQDWSLHPPWRWQRQWCWGQGWCPSMWAGSSSWAGWRRRSWRGRNRRDWRREYLLRKPPSWRSFWRSNCPAEDHSEDQTVQLKIILGSLLCSDQTCSALWLQLGALLPGLFWEQCYCTRVHRSNWKPITPHWIRRFNREMHTFYQISIDRDVMLTNTGWIKNMPLILLLQSFPEQCYIYCSLRSNWQPISAHWISPWASNG